MGELPGGCDVWVGSQQTSRSSRAKLGPTRLLLEQSRHFTMFVSEGHQMQIQEVCQLMETQEKVVGWLETRAHGS